MRRRRAVVVFIVGTIVLVLFAGALPRMVEESLPQTSGGANSGIVGSDTSTPQTNSTEATQPEPGSALAALQAIEVKGRAAKTGYARDQFGDGWAKVSGCSTRDIILHRDLADDMIDENCKVVSGVLNDPYTGESIQFTKTDSAKVQIDHVVALSDAWQKGAQQLTRAQRIQLANDPLELLAVSGAANQAKSDGDAATWLPKNKSFRCEYVARQIAVKQKYTLWVTQAEKDAIIQVLATCPLQPLPV